MDPAWIALIATFVGGIGLKITEKLLARGQAKEDTATALREELRTESAALREEVRTIDHELDMWKEKYFTLMSKYIELKGEVLPPPVPPPSPPPPRG